jgi:biopolymer transport protein ExbD
MAISGGGLKRKSKAQADIPQSSLADIAFLLLIFFMVSTAFRTERQRPITWPAAAAALKIDEKAKNILNIWVERDGSIWMNDQNVAMEQVSDVVGPMYVESDRHLVISVRADRETPYSHIDGVQKELVAAGVVRVVFATQLERQMTGVRR